MPSTSAPSDAPEAEGSDGPAVWHYDGQSALRRRAVLAIEGDAFRLIEAERTTGPFAFADLVARDKAGRDSVYGLNAHTGWRIVFDGGVPVDVQRHLPRDVHYGGLIDRWGLWRAVAVFAVLAGIAIFLFLRTPALVARAVPASVERRLGDVMVGDFGRKGCATPEGLAAMDVLVHRVDPYDPGIEVHVVKLPIVNAVTLPGGRIVLFDGLVQKATSPDEVAGVIAHEIGHVRHRDVTESLLRQLGLSVLLGGLEGHVGGYTNALLAASYSRGAEARADGFAIDLLKEAKISPRPTVAFFRRLSMGGAERMLAYVSTHPVSNDRAQRFLKSVDPGLRYTPTLDAAQWRALKTMCAATKSENGWRF